ncbi:hypothetical protein OG448_28020 [Streptomyces sp. NBC_01171]|nr:hypothetical protein OG448_28020 [Streptomyces sp. NBC_01171]
MSDEGGFAPAPRTAEEALEFFHDGAYDYTGEGVRRDFAREAAGPARPVVADVTRDELVEIVRRLLAADPDSDHYLRLLKANTPHPRVSDLVFHSPGACAE